MRTHITVVIILILLLGGSLVSYEFIQRTTQSLDSQISTVEQSISGQQWAMAQNKLKETQQRWDKNKIWWTILLDHQEIDKIDFSLSRLDKYLVTQNLPLSLGEVSTLELLISHISETEKFTLENIL
ncbi:hypothetical protein DEAC_c37260 [Desulfosporosinus acididurans]|uniref:DUF4363 family protein n=1 Tax=Desulfosporosinus acididurans TaxID=476652 RepID=A0A0J1IHY2_9FIRM|nr:DUF4363 family protein [Desulfosporosinus acididurans]KLU64296.1 hypothetical protein DEAC_c37260 [Desulfosporosinus acididurans]